MSKEEESREGKHWGRKREECTDVEGCGEGRQVNEGGRKNVDMRRTKKRENA